MRVLLDDRDQLSVGSRLKDAELMGGRVAIVVGNQFEKSEMIDLRLLHKQLIEDVVKKQESQTVGRIHDALRQKVESFDIDRLEQLGYQIRQDTQEKQSSMENDGFSIRCGFSTLYWNLIQTLSCIKTYSSKN